uniref:RNA-directed RNA polymerase n=1 Tax=Wuhan insect virus 29 TaxID=1923733 RepID=A0A1L3KFJ4_9VIRU|nr:hypothetical protein [Wuhan insect virus 29]
MLSSNTVRIKINRCYSLCVNKSVTPWIQAVAARVLEHLLGAAVPQEALHHHNYHLWARIIQAVEQHALPDVQGEPDYDWSEKFQYGAGNSRFALGRIEDWLGLTNRALYKRGYRWFKQLLNRNDCSYERALCMLIMGDVWAYVAPDIGKVADRLRIGGLDPLVYVEVGKAIHTAVRGSNTLLGRKLLTRDLAVCSYWDCLAGRYFGAGDMEKEIADRTSDLKPKVFIMEDGSRSHEGFMVEFRRAVKEVLSSTVADGGEKMRRGLDIAKDFDTFLEFRKSWVRPGSVTGSPKTDIALKAVGERETMIAEIADEIHTMGLFVLHKVRLNKAATFEFPEFVGIVKKAIGDYVPNSFTRYFIKNEIAKPKGRALYPSHVLHYIIASYCLHLLMKGLPIEHARLVPEESIARDEHWMWRQARDFTVGWMADYDNFNESHEIEDMQAVMHSLKTVYRQAGAMSDDLRHMLDWVIEAYEKTILEYEGGLYKFKHGMLSGQAPTSAINTVMNASNKRVIRRQMHVLYGESVMNKRTSGGDDVAAEVYDAYQAALLIKVGQMMGFAFSSHKQLISTTNYEFFRLFISSEGTYGSLPRALGSLCSGQWSNSVKAKFVDPASKLSSVVEIARKAGRRAYCNVTFMDKVCAVAFKKWSTYGEQQLADGYIHGARDKGGLGIPRADGSVYDIEPLAKPKAEPVVLMGLPDDASSKLAQRQHDEALPIVGRNGVESVKIAAARMSEAVFKGNIAAMESVKIAAARMSEAVFKGNIAAMEGVGVAQILGDPIPQQSVKIRSVRNIPRLPDDGTLTARHYWKDSKRLADLTDRISSAGRRYDGLAQAVKSEYRRRLADTIALGYGIDGRLLYFWKEELTLYGCGTYLLTEDYYSGAVLLSLATTTKYTDTAVSERLAYYASALANSNLMNY